MCISGILKLERNLYGLCHYSEHTKIRLFLYENLQKSDKHSASQQRGRGKLAWDRDEEKAQKWIRSAGSQDIFQSFRKVSPAFSASQNGGRRGVAWQSAF